MLRGAEKRRPEPPAEGGGEETVIMPASAMSEQVPGGVISGEIGGPPPEGAAREAPAGAITGLQLERVDLTPEAQKTVAGSKPETRGFLGRLYERIKSSDIVQNIVDRVQIWRNDRLARRGQEKITALTTQRDQSNKTAAEATARITRMQEQFSQLETTLREIGRGTTAEARVKFDTEIRGHQTQADQARAQTRALEERITSIGQKRDGYVARVEKAREQIAGRLDAKIEAHTISVTELTANRDKIDSQIARLMQDRDTALTDRGRLETHLQQVPTGPEFAIVRSELERVIQDLNKNLANIEAEMASNADKRDEIERRIVPHDKAVADLRKQRDQIYPRPKEQAEEKPARQEAETIPGAPTAEAGGTTPSTAVDYGKMSLTRLEGELRQLGAQMGKSDLSNAERTQIDKQYGAAIEALTRRTPDDIRQEISDLQRTIQAADQKMVSWATEQVSRHEARLKEKERFTAGNIVREWNSFALKQKETGLRVSLAMLKDKAPTPSQYLKSSKGAADLLKSLFEKLSGGNRRKAEALLGSFLRSLESSNK